MRLLRPLLALAVSLPVLALAEDAAPGRHVLPDRHVLNVRFDPASGTLQGTDSLTTPWAKSLAIHLHDGLSFTATCAGRRLAGPGSATRGAATGELRIPRECAGPDGLVTIEFQFEGRIHDPVEQEPSLHFVTGDRTSGLISPEGIFLAGGTFWYPQTGRMETHDFTADLPAGWSACSQGARTPPLSPAPEGMARQRHVNDVAADGLAMSAGRYFVTTRQHSGLELATFLLTDDPARAKLLLDAAAVEIDRLVEKLGPYPHPKFDIVENFFATGHGFPGYTLLGGDILAMGERALRPGYLDHEIAHGWFGNYVHVDVAGGNWCEGLVSYLTNYLGAARGGDEEAMSARRRVSQRYSVDVPPAKDVAPAAFVTKTDDAGASIGYGKVSMIFHVLRRQLGDEPFWKGLRILVQDAGARRASWDDVESAFENASGKTLDAFFDQWVGRAGLPELALENVGEVTHASGAPHAVVGDIVQSGTPWTLTLDVDVLLVDGTHVSQAVLVSGERTHFDLPVQAAVSRVTLDPGFQVPRRIRPADMPASLARTLAGDGKPPLIVHPNVSSAPEDERAPFQARARVLQALAKAAAAQPGGGVVQDTKDVAEIEMTGSSVLALGGFGENAITRRYMPALRQALGVDVENDGSFRAGDRRWRGEGQSILASIPHPDRPGATITVFVPNGEAAVAEARKIFYYGWDSWVALDGGIAQQRGSAWPENTATSVGLAPLATPSTAEARIAATLARLTDPRLEGRESGSAGAREASTLVGEAFVAAGLETLPGHAYFDPFGFDLYDLPQQPVLKVDQPGSPAFHPVIPGHSWLKPPADFDATPLGSALTIGSVRAPIRVPAPRGLVFVGRSPAPSFEGLDLSQSFAVVLDAPGDGGARGGDETARRVREWLDEARRHEAAGLLVIRPGAAWPAPPRLAAYATLAAPPVLEKRERLVAEGGPRAPARAAMAERTRARELGIHESLPLVFGGKELAAALEAEGAFVQGRRTWEGRGVDVRFNVIAERLSDRNVVAVAHGASREENRPVVIVQAHHDAIGELADGRACGCALDDAGGVAVLLELATRFAAKPASADVVLVSTGGTEWGLQGARHLAADWSKSAPVRGVISLDAAGEPGQPLRVIGRARWPELAAGVERAAKAAGFEVATDAGAGLVSDQQPWSDAGIPAIGVLQADPAVAGTTSDDSTRADAATLSRLADAIEAAVREN